MIVYFFQDLLNILALFFKIKIVLVEQNIRLYFLVLKELILFLYSLLRQTASYN